MYLYECQIMRNVPGGCGLRGLSGVVLLLEGLLRTLDTAASPGRSLDSGLEFERFLGWQIFYAKGIKLNPFWQ